MVGDAVQDPPHVDLDTADRQVGKKLPGAVRLGENGLVDVFAHLAPVNVESGHNLDVTGLESAEIPVHQSDGVFPASVPIIVDPLHKRADVSVCTRLHFGRALEGEQNSYIRLAYSGINTPEIQEGLGRLKAFIES